MIVLDWTCAEVVKLYIQGIQHITLAVEDGNRHNFFGDLVDWDFELGRPVAGRLCEMTCTVQILSCFWNSF